MPEPVSVTVFPDGPLKISNAEAARYCGEPIDASGDLFICRCGDSTNVIRREQQTRRADEAITQFFTCKTCSHAWRVG